MMSQCKSSPPPLKHRRRSSVCHLCCFSAGVQDHTYPDSEALAFDMQSPRSSSWWLRSTAPEIRDRCCRLIGRSHRKFGYDPSSYALNFEEKWGQEEDEEFPLRNFLARLPATPETPTLAKCVATARRL